MELPAPGLQALTSADTSLSVPQSTVALRPIHTFAQTSLLSRARPPPGEALPGARPTTQFLPYQTGGRSGSGSCSWALSGCGREGRTLQS